MDPIEQIFERPDMFVAEADYDGSVAIYRRHDSAYMVEVNIGVADEYRGGRAYPLSMLNNRVVIVFPFGNLDLSYLRHFN